MSRGDGGLFADAFVADALAREFALSAAVSAGALPGSSVLASAMSSSGSIVWSASGLTAGGAVVSVTVTPSFLSDSSVLLSVSGTVLQTVSSTVAIPAGVYLAGAAATASFVQAAVTVSGGAVASAVASASTRASKSASDGASAVQSSLASTALSAILKKATLAALDSETGTAAATRASAVRATGIRVNAGVASSDQAVVTIPVVGAIMAPLAQANASGGGVGLGTIVGATLGGLILILALFFERYRRRRAALSKKLDANPAKAAAKRSSRTGSGAPTPQSPRHPPPLHANKSFSELSAASRSSSRTNSPSKKSVGGSPHRSKKDARQTPLPSPLHLSSAAADGGIADSAFTINPLHNKSKSTPHANASKSRAREQAASPRARAPLSEETIAMIDNPLGTPKKGLKMNRDIAVDDPKQPTSATSVNPPSADSFSFENPLVATADTDALPPGWSKKTSKTGTTFYAHIDGRKQKHAPIATTADAELLVTVAPAVAEAALPVGWRRMTSKSGTTFYAHADGRKQKSIPVN